MDRPSGDQKGPVAPSVPASGSAEVVASDRSHKRDAPSPEATKMICRPSGESTKSMGRSVAGVTISTRVSGGTGTVRATDHTAMPAAAPVITAAAAIRTTRRPRVPTYLGHRCLGLLPLHDGRV